MVIENFEGYFLILCVAVISFFTYLIFKPFISVIVFAMVISAVLYPVYKKLKKKLWNKSGLSSFFMCLLVVLVIVIPFFYFVVVLKNKSVGVYYFVDSQINDGAFQGSVIKEKFGVWEQYFKTALPVFKDYTIDIPKTLITITSYLNEYVIASTTELIKGTTKIISSFLFFLLTLFYMFKDGDRFAKFIMRLTPLSNKYDRKLFKRFKEVSMSSVVSTLLVAIAQGFICGIGLLIVGLPAFFGGVMAGVFSLVPLLGTTLVWLPVALYLFIIGKYFSGIFLILYGVFVIGLADNLLRPLLMKGKTEIHPLLILFSVLGGISLFGFTGIIFGPLVLSLLITFLHIYELEYDYLLEKQ